MERRPLSPELNRSVHLRIAFLASHNGTSMQAALEAMREGKVNAEPSIIISNNSKERALQIAKEQEIPWAHISNVTHPNATDEAIRDALLASQADLVICSGWNKIIGNKTLETFQNRIINIHPAIHEEFMGNNWMDLAVHEAVIKAGKTLSGYTMHLMTPVVDEGQVITTGALRVEPWDDKFSLQAKVKEAEGQGLVGLLNDLSFGTITLPGVSFNQPQNVNFTDSQVQNT